MQMKPEYLGDLAIAAREKLGLSQREMAAHFGLSLNAWQKKEQNETRCSVAEQRYFILIIENKAPPLNEALLNDFYRLARSKQ